ncbi:hypothetical protein IPZ58_11645 [Streptomyces roseoverticillatus]|uniref:hypothetical protein n=1 Tax=Streptomyces roseoverticillatus TaxID=66429 RepID=UPI001F1E183D|nr:hypothetical protein [Streptomyces roseoverticillatus]MCF3102237.1 hypothetical protein [Streptomyces roseoverticillatus]
MGVTFTLQGPAGATFPGGETSAVRTTDAGGLVSAPGVTSEFLGAVTVQAATATTEPVDFHLLARALSEHYDTIGGSGIRPITAPAGAQWVYPDQRLDNTDVRAIGTEPIIDILPEACRFLEDPIAFIREEDEKRPDGERVAVAYRTADQRTLVCPAVDFPPAAAKGTFTGARRWKARWCPNA